MRYARSCDVILQLSIVTRFSDYDFFYFILFLYRCVLLNCDNQSNGVAGILHTIVFHRALGLVRPKDVDLELFDVTYVLF